ncbi:MAG: hypothetical protein Q7S35_06650 [Candidatus Limnocylindrales bacterium]|nr:hypothetical protein [Candidatus Limnocylindrales bacterium]
MNIHEPSMDLASPTLVVQEATADTSQVTGGPVAAAARAAGSTAVTCQIPIIG